VQGCGPWDDDERCEVAGEAWGEIGELCKSLIYIDLFDFTGALQLKSLG